ncbi:MAG: HAMP domain-containing sensor histidine kinase [Candidatus Ozemobacteraceae bacterium]
MSTMFAYEHAPGISAGSSEHASGMTAASKILELKRPISFELSQLWFIAVFMGLCTVGTLVVGLEYAEPRRVMILFSVFVVVNVISAMVAVSGVRCVPTHGLAYDAAWAISLALVLAATANSLDLFLWLGFDVPLKSSMVPNLFFCVALVSGLGGIFQLARLSGVSPGTISLGGFFASLLLYALLTLLIDPRVLTTLRETPGGPSKEFFFGVVYAIALAYIAAVSAEVWRGAEGRLGRAARTITLGTIFLSFGCFIYGVLFIHNSNLEVAVSTVHIILGLSYACIGLGVFRMGNTMMELFEADLSEMDPRQPLIELFGPNIGVKVYEAMMMRISDSETARRVAESESLAKTRFLAMMSHELRTPLTTVLAYSQLINDEAAPFAERCPPEVRDFSRRISSSALHLVGLIDGLLHFSRPDAGGGRGDVQDFDLETILDFVKNQVDPLKNGKPVEFLCRIPDHPVSLRTDPQMLRQVIINLLVNAFKFTRQGEVSLEISVSSKDFSATVTDSGIGISEEEQENVFKPFYQASIGRTRRFGGVGLGLSIVKNLVEQTGGSIEISSKQGAGTKVCFRIPGIVVPLEHTGESS